MVAKTEAGTRSESAAFVFDATHGVDCRATKRTILVSMNSHGISVGGLSYVVYDAWCCGRGIVCVSSLSLHSLTTDGCFIGYGAVLSGVVLGAHTLVIATEGFASVAAPQVAFVAVGLTRHLVLAMRLIPHVQAAIGQQLRAQLEVPRSLSPELAALVAQLGRAYRDCRGRRKEPTHYSSQSGWYPDRVLCGVPTRNRIEFVENPPLLDPTGRSQRFATARTHVSRSLETNAC